jgi:hypothetical protein
MEVCRSCKTFPLAAAAVVTSQKVVLLPCTDFLQLHYFKGNPVEVYPYRQLAVYSIRCHFTSLRASAAQLRDRA